MLVLSGGEVGGRENSKEFIAITLGKEIGRKKGGVSGKKEHKAWQLQLMSTKDHARCFTAPCVNTKTFPSHQ